MEIYEIVSVYLIVETIANLLSAILHKISGSNFFALSENTKTVSVDVHNMKHIENSFLHGQMCRSESCSI